MPLAPLKKLTDLGNFAINFVSHVGTAGILLWQILYRRPRFVRTFPLLLQQLYSIGTLSLVITIVAGAFVGMVVALQGYNTLLNFGATAELGTVLALSIARELGPVVTALLFAGRAGAALAAEIGLMKVTEQLSSMEIMGVDPIWYIASPRFWAGVISLPLLAIIFDAFAMLGGSAIGIDWLNVDSSSFWSNMQSAVDFYGDIVTGIIKSTVFGIAVSWIAIYQGINCRPTAEGIGHATTQTVVYSSLSILSLDFILTATTTGGW